MKKKILSLVLMLLFSINLFAFADSEVPVDQKKELLRGIYMNIRQNAKEDVQTVDLFLDTIMKLIGEDDAAYEKVLSALLQSVDEYGDYINKEDSKIWEADLTGEAGGIGAVVEMRNGRLTISSVLAGAPAERAGVKADYVLLKAGDVDLSGMSLNQALSYVRGEIGTSVDITFEIAEGQTTVLTIIRDKIDVTSVTGKILGENEDIGYVVISNFSDKTGEELFVFLRDYAEKNIENVILDLRYNGGGTLNGALEVANLFLEEGKIILTEEYKDPEDIDVYKAIGDAFDFKLVVLVNEYSASASEVVTGALKDHKRAVVIGERTYGKGTVQQLYPLYRFGGTYKFTIAHYKTPSGVSINKVGIAPNMTVENKKHQLSSEELPHFTFERELKAGDSGADVLAIKKGLSILKYKVSDSDTYDYDTVHAIKSFQKSMGMEPTGDCDAYTMQALYTMISESEFYEDTQLEAAIQYFAE